MEESRHLLRRVAVVSVSVLVIAATLAVAWRGNAHEVITTKITFNKEIVRILSKSCMSCHRPGGLAPMALTTYQEARPWAKAIKEEVLERRMPPWHAVAGYGEFANDPSLAGREIDLITAWVDGGAPKGDDKDLAPLPDFDQEWRFGTPDLILKPSEPYSFDAGENDNCRCFVLQNPSARDRWIKAIDLRPGDGSVVQRALIWIDRTGKSDRLDMADEKPGYGCFGGPGFQPSANLGGWVPGQNGIAFPSGTAHLLPRGARLVMQVHYRQSGGETRDLTRVGLYFAKGAVEKKLRSAAVVNTRFEIPPGDPSFRVKATYTFSQNAEAISVLPHMHFLGKSIEVAALRPDGTRETSVWVRNYDVKWQSSYIFKRPVALPAGTRVEVTAYYDNSDRNSRNPNQPPAPVRWGESARDEMCAAYLTYTLKNELLTQGRSGQ
jgi:Copper type II ascorbate-dependent monooxygenase, C-terminal domain